MQIHLSSYIAYILSNKKYGFFILFILLSLFNKQLYAQSNKSGINFQAVARDKAGNPANSRKIYIESTILKGGPMAQLFLENIMKAKQMKMEFLIWLLEMVLVILE